MSNFTRLSVIALGLVSALTLSSCGDDSSPTAPTAQGAGHGGPRLPRRAGGRPAGGQRRRRHRPGVPEQHGLPAGPGRDAQHQGERRRDPTTVINADLPVTAGSYYTVFAADSVANIAPLVLADDLTTPAAGKAHVRFVHLSPNAPAVDVAVTAGPVLFANTRLQGLLRLHAGGRRHVRPRGAPRGDPHRGAAPAGHHAHGRQDLHRLREGLRRRAPAPRRWARRSSSTTRLRPARPGAPREAPRAFARGSDPP